MNLDLMTTAFFVFVCIDSSRFIFECCIQKLSNYRHFYIKNTYYKKRIRILYVYASIMSSRNSPF